MLIGVPREIKVHEYRVGLTPESVRELAAGGHRVMIESGAGAGIAASDADYRAAGATMVGTAEEVFASAELIVKVKEPQAAERARLRRGQTIFTYLHLAPDPAQVRDLVRSGVTAIAYETITDADGRLPLLRPMSEIAGRMATQVAAHFLERPHGGRGVLMAGATGVAPARVLVLGAGVVGSNAAMIALGMGAEVTIMNPTPVDRQRLAVPLPSRLRMRVIDAVALNEELRTADAVIGAALVPGGLAPKLVTRAMLALMQAGAVLVDVSIDQGGCFETSRPTTHADPVYVVDGIVHYCVANMPGAVPRTSTYALNRATLPFVRKLADRGVMQALRDDEHLRHGLNVHAGAITQRAVAAALGVACVDTETALSARVALPCGA